MSNVAYIKCNTPFSKYIQNLRELLINIAGCICTWPYSTGVENKLILQKKKSPLDELAWEVKAGNAKHVLPSFDKAPNSTANFWRRFCSCVQPNRNCTPTF